MGDSFERRRVHAFHWDADGSFEWDFRPAPRQRAGGTAVALPAPRQGLVRLSTPARRAAADPARAGLPLRVLVLAALTLVAIVVGLAIRTQLARPGETALSGTVAPAVRAPAVPPAAQRIRLSREPRVVAASAPPVVRPAAAHALPKVVWRHSRSLGLPWAGRLVGGVRLPAEGANYFTWDGVLRRSPSREWRRYGSDRLIRTLLAVLASYHVAHPEAPRVGIGDLSRPNGGVFGRRFGGLGHVSHQNGLDVDVYYPRLDGKEAEPATPGQIDRRLAQDLVNRFVKAGAQFVFVGPSTHLRGPSGTVQVLAHHDDHLHVRIYPAGQ